MPKGKAAPKFTGDLAKPIVLPTAPSAAVTDLLPDEDVKYWQRVGKIIASETVRKLVLLAQHYGVKGDDPNAFALPLLLELSKDFVPGFRVKIAVKANKGRPVEWDASRTALFVADVDAVIKEKRCNQREAILHLMKTRPEYKPNGGLPRSDDLKAKAIDAMVTRLSEAKRGPLSGLVAALKQHGVESVLYDTLRKAANQKLREVAD